jgi:hypothetical protein
MGGNYFVLAAGITAFLGVVPLLIKGRLTAAAVLGGLAFLLLWLLFYATTPSTVYPFWGPVGFFCILLWTICAIVDGIREKNPTWVAAVPIVGCLIWFGSMIAGWSAFNAQTYATMIGPIEERVWTRDVQPKDTRHMIMVSSPTADFLARKAVAQGGTIGSQFSLDVVNVRLQRVNGEFIYVYPLDFKGYSTWLNSSGVPAYIIVYAEDPERAPHLVTLPPEKAFRYTPGAYFSADLERHMRNNGFLNDGLDDFHLELDEEGNPLWVVTTYKPSVTWYGAKVTGVSTINPVNGVINRYSVENAPAWIDRIIPRAYVEDYLEWHGALSGGWLNSWWGTLNVTKPEQPILIYGADGNIEFVTSMTSRNNKDDSLVGLMYTDSRTGKTILYKVNGGATDAAIMYAVNKNSQVQFRHLTATTPQIYNVYGSMAAVVPLVNATGAFQGVAIVSVLNVQDVAVGATPVEALRNYQTLASRQGQQVALQKSADVKQLTGVIDRIRQDIGSNGGPYLFHVEGVPRIFMASSQEYSKLPLTQVGDSVTIEYVASGEETVPVLRFDNLSLPLDKTEMQQEVERAAAARIAAEGTRRAEKSLVDQLKGMSPDKLKQLEQLLRQTQ